MVMFSTVVLDFESVAGWVITGGEEEWDGSAGAGSEGFLFFAGSFCVCIHFGSRSSDDFSSMSDSTGKDDPVSCM